MYCMRCGQPMAEEALACAACQTPVPPSLLPKGPIDQDLGVLPLDFALPQAESLGALMDHSLKTYLSVFPLLAKLTLIIWIPVSLATTICCTRRASRTTWHFQFGWRCGRKPCSGRCWRRP